MEKFKNNKFKKFGDFVEDEVLKEIKKKFPLACNINKEGVKNKKYDIKIPETNKTIEVKVDYISAGTGNILVEVVGWDGNSGLTTTEADYWVFITGFRKIWITPLELYRFIETHPKSHGGREPINGKGDSYNKLAYKIKNDDLVVYISKLEDKRKGYVELITDKNDPLFWFNCLEYNSDLNNYAEKAKQIMNDLNIK